MPSKRSKQKNVQRFYCPKCDRRLWRVGSLKHFLSHAEVLENQRYVKISHQGALLLTAKDVCVDRNSWIEEFICGEHGTLWMKLNQQADGSLRTSLATTNDWRRTSYTLQPETPNPIHL